MILTAARRASLPSPHSVVTQNLIDRAGEPTAKARGAILAFLAQRLLARPAPVTS